VQIKSKEKVWTCKSGIPQGRHHRWMLQKYPLLVDYEAKKSRKNEHTKRGDMSEKMFA